MGYSTFFEGTFNLSKPLTIEQKQFLDGLYMTRRVKRDPFVLYKMYEGKFGNPMALDTKNPNEIYGIDGEFFVNPTSEIENDPSFISYEIPGDGDKQPKFHQEYIGCEKKIKWLKKNQKQPGPWCQWVIGDDLKTLGWDGEEKFYYHVEWLQYLINAFFIPWRINLNGEVKYFGESPKDRGRIVVINNKVNVFKSSQFSKIGREEGSEMKKIYNQLVDDYGDLFDVIQAGDDHMTFVLTINRYEYTFRFDNSKKCKVNRIHRKKQNWDEWENKRSYTLSEFTTFLSILLHETDMHGFFNITLANKLTEVLDKKQ